MYIVSFYIWPIQCFIIPFFGKYKEQVEQTLDLFIYSYYGCNSLYLKYNCCECLIKYMCRSIYVYQWSTDWQHLDKGTYLTFQSTRSCSLPNMNGRRLFVRQGVCMVVARDVFTPHG